MYSSQQNLERDSYFEYLQIESAPKVGSNRNFHFRPGFVEVPFHTSLDCNVSFIKDGCRIF